MKNKIIVQKQLISIIEDDYISLTDIARSKNSDEPKDVVKNWLRSKNTIAFLGLWGKINNPNFKGVEFDSFLNEADLLNVALFGLTAKQWNEQNPKLKGNMRDYASAEQLVVLANLENLNAQFIKQNTPHKERLISLNEVAIEQLGLLLNYKTNKLENR